MMDALISIRGFSGPTGKRVLSDLYTNIRCIFSSARLETVAMYEGVPQGKIFEFTIHNSNLAELPPASELKVTNPQQTGIAQDAIFVVEGQTQRQRISGRFIISGVCFRKEA